MNKIASICTVPKGEKRSDTARRKHINPRRRGAANQIDSRAAERGTELLPLLDCLAAAVALLLSGAIFTSLRLAHIHRHRDLG